jgi:UDP-N-acetylmuramate--alanine ligase
MPASSSFLRHQARQSGGRHRARPRRADRAPRRDAGRADAPEVDVAIGGTHGKTTTTSMVAALLDAGQKDPTVINGGIINAYGTNARMGEGEWMVVEADESDGTFLRCAPPPPSSPTWTRAPRPLRLGRGDERGVPGLRREHAVLRLRRACASTIPQVQALIRASRDRRIITYGFNPAGRCARRQRAPSTPTARVRRRRPPQRRGTGRHHARSLPCRWLAVTTCRTPLAAIAVARETGRRPTPASAMGLKKLRRREAPLHHDGLGNGVRIVDDYGHHPVEIAAVLKPRAK